MKLISCTIENYGKLQGVTFDFNEGITAFCEKNGYGKTTLASFLKAMFYGLESYRAGGKFCDRVRFYPFQGGKFGGNLTFQMGGNTYKIERFFDEKSETRDELTVYCNGSVYQKFGSDIGKAIFGIDKASFERTVFIDSDEIEIASTGSINAKLNTFVEGGNDDNLESAVGILEKASKEYKKSKAGSDLITGQKNRIAELTQKIANLKNIYAALQEKYRDYDERKQLLEETEKRVIEAQKVSVVANNWERLDAMQKEYDDNCQKIKDIQAKYVAGLPKDSELEQVKTCLAEEQKLHGKSTQKVFSEEDENKLSALGATFAKGVPDEQTLDYMEQTIASHSALQTQISLAERAEVSEREARLKRNFANGVPTEKELESTEKSVEKWKEAERVWNEIPATISQITAQTVANEGKNHQKMFAVMAAFSALLLVAGIALFFVMRTVGIALFAVGAVLLLVCGFLYLNKKSSNKNVTETVIQVENPQKRQAEQEMNALQNQIQAFLFPYGYASTNGILFDFASLKEDLKFYASYLSVEQARLDRLEKNKQQAQQCEQAITSFFAQYGYGGKEWLKNLANLRADVKMFESLSSRHQSDKTEQEALKVQREKNIQPVIDFCNRYQLSYETINNTLRGVEADRIRLQELQKKVEQDSKKMQAFQSEKGLTERPAQEDADLVTLNNKLHVLQQTQSGKLREITEDELLVEDLDDLQSQLEEAEEKLKDYKKKYDLLMCTIDMLRQADYSLKERYIKPVKDSFLKYSAVLEKALGEKVTMSKDFEIRYERGGKERSERHLSAGQRSLCALCFRLALIENMYATEKPFLILDDPFVSLDDEHMQRARLLLNELTKGMQIIYFACHPSRDLNN